jgi:hypothetical protein
MVRNAPNHEFMVQWGESGAFVAKNSNATSSHELVQELKQFDSFAPTFVQ